MVDREDKRFFDFMCSCGEEGKQRCEKVYDDVMSSFQKDSRREITDRDFVDIIVFELNNLNNGVANIEHIYTDMWSGIAVKYQYDYKEDDFCTCGKNGTVEEDDCECSEWTTQDFWIECDRIHHGLARAYQLVKEFDESLAND